MPTTVIVDADHVIRWIDVHPDYSTRSERAAARFLKRLGYRILVSPFRNDQHALLRFAEQDLVRRHSTFARQHFGDIDGDTHIAALRHLRRR